MNNTYITIYSHIDNNDLKAFFKSLKLTNNGYAGFSKKTYLKDYLLENIFGEDGKHKAVLNVDENNLKNLVETTLNSVESSLTNNTGIEVHIFPTLSKFVANEMGGVNGYTPYRGVIHLFINPSEKSREALERNICNTTAHEYNHAVRLHYFPDQHTFISNLIFEGLAENFREAVFKNEPSRWSTALNKTEAQKIFKTLKPLLFSDEYTYEDYKQIFFGGDKYKTWTGYSVGYYLVKDYLTKKNSKDWNLIIQADAEEILTVSGWR